MDKVFCPFCYGKVDLSVEFPSCECGASLAKTLRGFSATRIGLKKEVKELLEALPRITKNCSYEILNLRYSIDEHSGTISVELRKEERK